MFMLQEDLDYDSTDEAHPRLLNAFARPEEEEEDSGQWLELVERARARSDFQHDLNDRCWKAEDGIVWQIGCKVSIANAF